MIENVETLPRLIFSPGYARTLLRCWSSLYRRGVSQPCRVDWPLSDSAWTPLDIGNGNKARMSYSCEILFSNLNLDLVHNDVTMLKLKSVTDKLTVVC